MSKEIKIDESSYLMLLNQIWSNKNEERDLALDRYRKSDEAITNNEHFIMMGKNSAAFLRQASDATNDLANLAKEIKSIIFKESDNQASGANNQSADQMRAIIDMAKAEAAAKVAEDEVSEKDAPDNTQA